jgi:hypothetical protein
MHLALDFLTNSVPVDPEKASQVYYDRFDICKIAIFASFSINPNPGDILFLPGDICKIHSNSSAQYVVYQLI